jgi:hypothetical protein
VGDVREALEKSVAAASHLTPMDAGAVEAARALADKIDAWDAIVEWALDDAGDKPGARPAVPQNDNVSIPSYLKFCESLGLTPAGRARLPEKKQEAPSGKLALLRGEAKANRKTVG